MALLQDTKDYFSSTDMSTGKECKTGIYLGVSLTGVVLGLSVAYAAATIEPKDYCSSRDAGAKILCMAGFGKPSV